MINYLAILLLITCPIALIISVFYDLKNIKQPYYSFIVIYLAFSVTYLFVASTGFLPNILGTSYKYSNLPKNLKEIVLDFEKEATKRNVDISKLANTKIVYLEWDTPIAPYAGLCNTETNTIYLPAKEVSQKLLFHELGHCVLGYDHLEEDSLSDEIMYYKSNDSLKISKETLDNFFFNSPQYKEDLKNRAQLFNMFLSIVMVSVFIMSFITLIRKILREKVSKT